jgi:biopolymer transport protein ExbD
MTFDQTDVDELRSEINVTPLVDVMLVLLVVFMVVTPLLRREVPVELPAAATSRDAGTEAQVLLTATGDGGLLLDGVPLAESELAERLHTRYASHADRTIFLAADRGLPYSRVVDLMDACRGAGVERIGIVTQQPPATPPAAPAPRTSTDP